MGLVLSAAVVIGLGACSSKDDPQGETPEGSGGEGNTSGGASSGGGSASGGSHASGGSGSGGEGNSSGGSSSGGETSSGGSDASGGSSSGGEGSGGEGLGGFGGEGGGGSCYCYDNDLTWNRTGPFGGETDTMTFSACETIHFLRDYSSGAQTDIDCDVEVDACAEEVSPTDVKEALTHPDVIAAFEVAPITFGKANAHASTYSMDLNGATITIRSECGGTPTCEDAPAALIELRNLLVQLGEEMVARPECAL